MAANQSERQNAARGRVTVPWIQALVLFGIWVLFSGKFDWFHLSCGVLAVAFVLWLDRKLGPANLRETDLPVRVHPVRLALYFPWLVWQMMLSAYEVARIILGQGAMHPRMVSFDCEQPHTVARVVLGNSITLTPGTLTLHIEGDRYLVHALSENSLQGLLAGDMQRKVAEMFWADGKGAVSNVKIGDQGIRGGIPG